MSLHSPGPGSWGKGGKGLAPPVNGMDLLTSAALAEGAAAAQLADPVLAEEFGGTVGQSVLRPGTILLYSKFWCRLRWIHGTLQGHLPRFLTGLISWVHRP